MKALKNLVFSSLFISSLAFAQAPWEEGHAIDMSDAPYEEMTAMPMQAVPVQQIVTAQPAQAVDANAMSLVNQMAQMQEQLRQLQGQVEMLNHQLGQAQAKTGQTQEFNQNMAKPASSPGYTQNNADYAAAGNPNNGLASKETIKASNQVPVSQDPFNAAPVSSQPSAQEDLAYQQAYSLLGKKRYTEAQAGLKAYLQQYPQGHYADGAHYWLGELYLIAGNDALALKEFNTLASNYPKSAKAGDALLKTGIIYANQNNWQMAKQQLNKVKAQYPNTNYSASADQKLKQLNAQGH